MEWAPEGPGQLRERRAARHRGGRRHYGGPEGLARWRPPCPSAAWARPSDVAGACLFLASRCASYVSGAASSARRRRVAGLPGCRADVAVRRRGVAVQRATAMRATRRSQLLDRAPVKLAVPTETRPGERRVALIPDVVKRLVGAGWEVGVQAGAGAAAAFTDAAYARGRRHGRARRRRHLLGGRPGRARSTPPTAEEVAGVPEGAARAELLQRGRSPSTTVRVLAGQGGHGLQLRPAAPDQPGPVDGRPHLPGDGVGLPRRAGGGRAPGQVLPHVHDGGRHRPAGQGARDGGRAWPGCRPSPPPGGSARSVGLRRAGRGQGGGREPRGHLRRARRLGRGRRRLRPGAHRRGARPPARALADEVAASDVVITTAAVPGRKAPVLVTDGDGRARWPRVRSSSTWPPTRAATAS